MPKKDKKPKGQYHYAIKTLKSEVRIIQTIIDAKWATPKRLAKLQSLRDAIDVLADNNLPPTPPAKSRSLVLDEAGFLGKDNG